jgi:hypothetical protein
LDGIDSFCPERSNCLTGAKDVSFSKLRQHQL